MLFALLTFGSIWFWGLLAVEALFLFYFIEQDKRWSAFLSLLLIGILLFVFGDKQFYPNLFHWIVHNPIYTAIYVGIYLVGGMSWSVAKWYFHLLRAREQYQEALGKLKQPVDEKVKQDLLTTYKPHVGRNKSRILFWMTYWPFSAAWTVIHDPVTWFFNWAYLALGKLFQSMADSVFAETK